MDGIEVFPMIPAEARSMWPLLLGLLALVVVLGGVMGVLGYSARNVRFEISAEGLHVRGDIFGRLVPAAILDTDGAMPLDLDIAPDFRPRRRRIGTALPSYRAGWFTLNSGERALLFVTDHKRVVYVPTREGYAVMVSVENPRAFIEALMRVAPPVHETFRPPRPSLE